jgi:hypothetical protein
MMRRFAIAVVLGAVLTTAGSAAEHVAPSTGQTIEAFEAANSAELTTAINKIHYTTQKCPLKPSPFPDAPETYIGYGVRESHGDETRVDLIGVRDGRVTVWKEFVLPDFEGWFTHYVWECKGATFQVLDRSKVEQRFRWTGSRFVKTLSISKRS